jgi:hypothetical protein
MSQHRKGAILMLVLAAVCLVLQQFIGIAFGLVAVFVVGLGGGLLIGERMSEDAAQDAAG